MKGTKFSLGPRIIFQTNKTKSPKKAKINENKPQEDPFTMIEEEKEEKKEEEEEEEELTTFQNEIDEEELKKLMKLPRYQLEQQYYSLIQEYEGLITKLAENFKSELS